MSPQFVFYRTGDLLNGHVRLSKRIVIDLNARMPGLPIFGVTGRSIGRVTSSRLTGTDTDRPTLYITCTFPDDETAELVDRVTSDGSLSFGLHWDGPAVEKDQKEPWVTSQIVARAVFLR